MKRNLFPRKSFRKIHIPRPVIALFIVTSVAALGIQTLESSHAASPYASTEAESGTTTGCAKTFSNVNAGGGQYVTFGATCSATSANYYGVNWHPIWINAGGQNDEMNLMQAAGIKSVRLDAPWNFIEPTEGNYNQTYLSRLDNAIEGLDARGIDPLVIVTATPTWVSGAPTGDTNAAAEPPIRSIIGTGCNATITICTPYNGSAAYDSYLSFLMQRWLGKVHEYEIWNEPDGGWSWQTTQPNYLDAATDDAIDYTTLLKSAYTTAKAIDPSVTVLGGAMSGTGAAQQTFLKTMYAQEAEKYFDVLSQHYYCDPPSDNWCAYTGTTASRDIDDPVTIGSTFAKFIYPIMEANGDSTKPVWITETGYNSYSAGGGISEAEQGTYLTQAYNEAKTLPNVARLYWYDMDCTDSGTSTQNYYCMLDANTYNANSIPTGSYRLKPAYNALQQLTGAN